MTVGVQRGGISMKCIEDQFQLVDTFTKALDAVTFIKFRDMLVVLGSTPNLGLQRSNEPEKDNSEEPLEKKNRK